MTAYKVLCKGSRLTLLGLLQWSTIAWWLTQQAFVVMRFWRLEAPDRCQPVRFLVSCSFCLYRLPLSVSSYRGAGEWGGQGEREGREGKRGISEGGRKRPIDRGKESERGKRTASSLLSFLRKETKLHVYNLIRPKQPPKGLTVKYSHIGALGFNLRMWGQCDKCLSLMSNLWATSSHSTLFLSEKGVVLGNI